MGIVNAHEQLRQGIRQGKFLGGIMDKIVPNEITSFMNSAADKLMPKELAPFASFLAPILTPIIGPYAAHAFAQLGSAKMNNGQLDPLAALAVHGAGSTATAREIRANYDPSLGAFAEGQGGTLGQRLSGATGDFFSGEKMFGQDNIFTGTNSLGGTAKSKGNLFSRAFQPTQSMSKGTSAFGNNIFAGNTLPDNVLADIQKNGLPAGMDVGAAYMESPAAALEQLADARMASSIRGPNRLRANAIRSILDVDNPNFDPTKTGYAMEKQLREGVDAIAAKPSLDLTADGKKYFKDQGIATDSYYNRERVLKGMKPEDVGKYFKTSPAFDALEGNRTALQTLTEGATDYLAPGLDDLQQTLGMGDAKFLANFKNLDLLDQIQTITVLAVPGTMQAAEKAIRETEFKNKQERDAVYREFFDSYERYGGRRYNDPRYLRYKDPEMVKIYEEIYGKKDGGRIHKNMGGIMEVAPGVPQGMELDYRNSGGFIPMGGPERADDVPAMLSKNEFVLTADAMRGLDKMNGGSGDPRNAAKQMYQMMEQMEAMA